MIRLRDVRAARRRVRRYVLDTPLLASAALSHPGSLDVRLKAENLQHAGSFKIRGALNRISHLSPTEKRRGVIAASAGNHAQGVALAASLVGTPATIVMPEDSPITKVERTRRFGAEVTLVPGGLEEAIAAALRLGAARGLTFIHPYDDPLIQAGQGTVALEILAAAPEVTSIVIPVGGGGLIAGMAVAIKESRRGVKVFGVEAQGAAPAAASLRRGRRVVLRRAVTLADGIRLREVAESTLAVMRRHVDDVVTVTDEEISQAMVLLLEDARLVVEGAGAAGVAALLGHRLPRLGRHPVVVLSGGNADTNLLARVIERGLTAAGRYVFFRTRVPDKPGQLKGMLEIVASERANILDIQHHRTGWRVPLGDVEIEMLLEMRHPSHGREILAALRARGITAEMWGKAAYHRRWDLTRRT